MRELIASVASVQESAVTQLPQPLEPGRPLCSPVLVPPLPLGPNERQRYHVDGGVETATTEELGIENTGGRRRKQARAVLLRPTERLGRHMAKSNAS